MEKVKLTSMVKSSGCAAKLPPHLLHSVIDSLPKTESKKLLHGFETSDDASVYLVDDDTVCVQTVDFFPPMVDDPFVFGQVAAANALSDIYAMGGNPEVALNLMCFPSCLDIQIMKEILLGGTDKVKEAGAVISGGHTIEDATPKYGLCVTSFMKKNSVLTNSGAIEGNSIVLTKALGTGIINTAVKAGEASSENEHEVIKSMITLNRKAMELSKSYKVYAATDVTGFGLAGHLSEVMEASGVSCIIRTENLPLLNGALKFAKFGFSPEGRYSNEIFLHNKLSFSPGISREMTDICFDPQTSGGLLLFMDYSHALSYVNKFDEDVCRIIGSVEKRGQNLVEFC